MIGGDAAPRVGNAHDDQRRLRLVKQAPHGRLNRGHARRGRRHRNDHGVADWRLREQRAGGLESPVLGVLRPVHVGSFDVFEVLSAVQDGLHPRRNGSVIASARGEGGYEGCQSESASHF